MAVLSGTELYRDFTTQSEIDRAYDPALEVSGLADIRRGYAEHSDWARRTLDYVARVPFGPTLDEHVDIFPAGQPGAPVLLFIHGGYWRANTAQDFSCVALGPAALGMTVAVLNYSLCPHVTLDEITRQARAGVAWVVRNIDRYNGDPRRLVLAGHSAGAHLAAMCLQTPWAARYGLEDNCIRAALLVSGVYDIAPLRYSYLQPLIQLDEGIIQRNSPLFGVRPSEAQALITWGERESGEFARQSRDFHQRWLEAGNAGELMEQPGGDHFTAIHGFETPQSPLCQWLTRVA